MSFVLGTRSRSRLQGVDRRLVDVIELALTISLIDFGIPADGGVRTAERQHELFKDGKSKLDGFNRKSKHQTGKAFDVFAYVDGKASWDHLHLTHVATAILAAASRLGVPLRWGGHFKPNGWDMPHFELVD